MARADRPPRALVQGLVATLALALGVAGSGAARAHELEDGGVPDLPGWRLGAGLALDLADGPDPWPIARRSGLLLTGDRARDRREGLSLEQALVDGAVRVNRWWGLQWTLGAHDQDSPRTETARIELELPASLPGLAASPADRLRLRIGRQAVPMGPVIDGAGHFDRFAQAPLAKLGAVNEHWIDDGAELRWLRPEVERGLQSVGLGLWRARAFPGGPAGPAAPSLQLAAVWDHWNAQFFAAALRPQARGTAAAGTGGVGHTHGVPDCTRSLQGRACFEGRSQLLGASLAWDSADGRWQLRGAGLWRRERGELYSASASADYAGDTRGAWADLAWRWDSRWTLATRLEHLGAQHHLRGAGAARLAETAGLQPAPARQRLALAAGRAGRPGTLPLDLWLELGTERADGAGSQPYALLRLVWQAPQAWAGAF